VHREHFQAGEIVFEEGDVGDKIYFVVGGQAVVERGGVKVAAVAPCEVFGEAALIRKRARNATVRAATRLEVVGRYRGRPSAICWAICPGCTARWRRS
jgi:CRP-like cAMP-binding protein